MFMIYLYHKECGMDYFSLSKLLVSKKKYSKIVKRAQRLSQKKLGKILLDAISQGDKDVFDFVLPYLSDVNVKNSLGESATMYAAHYRQTEMFEALVERGAILGKTTKRSFSCTMDSIHECFNKSLFGPDLHYGNDIYYVHTKPGANELMYAVASVTRENSTDIVKAVLKAGQLDVNAQDADGYTALMYAAECGNVPAVLLLLEAGAKVDVQNKNGNTALMIALTRMHADFMVKALVLAGASETIKNNFGECAIDINEHVKKRTGVDALERANRAKNLANLQDKKHAFAIVKKAVNKTYHTDVDVEDENNAYFER